MHLLYFAVKLWLWGISSTLIFGKSEDHAHCLLKPITGRCKAAIPRWFFNLTSKSCQFFTYGGCGGNLNNFINETECQRECPGDVEWDKYARKHICSLSEVVGRCRAAFQRWYFNMEKGKCQRFIYGGCGGNANNFMTQAACEKFCADFIRDPCSQPIIAASNKSCGGEEKGTRYGYNRLTHKCESFTYSTCRENMNNFKTRKECYKTCASDSPCLYTTKLHTRRFYKSYYYDADKDTCRVTTTFLRKKDFYPKQNRFKKMNDCLRECMPVHTQHIKTQVP